MRLKSAHSTTVRGRSGNNFRKVSGMSPHVNERFTAHSNSLAIGQQNTVPFGVMKNNMLPELMDDRNNRTGSTVSKTHRGALSNNKNAGHNHNHNYNTGDEISPELAAKIVKNFILPMFESNEKKSLKTKYNKMSSISGGGIGQGKFKFNAAALG